MKEKIKKGLKILGGYLWALMFVGISVGCIAIAVKIFSVISNVTGWWVLLYFAAALALIGLALWYIRSIGTTCFIGLKTEPCVYKDVNQPFVVTVTTRTEDDSVVCINTTGYCDSRSDEEETELVHSGELYEGEFDDD